MPYRARALVGLLSAFLVAAALAAGGGSPAAHAQTSCTSYGLCSRTFTSKTERQAQIQCEAFQTDLRRQGKYVTDPCHYAWYLTYELSWRR